jgi:hypothetical protein
MLGTVAMDQVHFELASTSGADMLRRAAIIDATFAADVR